MNRRDTSYSLVLVGTGFASTFFLWKYLERAGPDARVLVLERGPRKEHRDLIELQFAGLLAASAGTFVNRTPEKPWIFSTFFGGGSNCWTGNTPRQLPEDFELFSRYGVGKDWPLAYDDLERFYCEAEDLMGIAGPSDDSPFPRSRPYPQPAHRMSDADLLFKKAFPSQFFALPTARPSRATERRPQCCANGVCYACPINSKFTVLNEAVGDAYRDPRVTLVLGARVDAVETQGDLATGVTYSREEREGSARGEIVALGANAIFNPHILLRSGRVEPALGRGLCEQVGLAFDVHLDGVDNFQGSSLHTGHGYMTYRGDFRRRRAASLIETWNAPPLFRMERGKWRRRMLFKFIFEDLPRAENHVRPSAEDPSLPEVSYAGHSDYTQRGIDALPDEIGRVLASFPVERVFELEFPFNTEAHIQCTTPMGDDPADSVVDRHLIHHQLRNLLVLGSSTFPTCPPANPTLTLSALSLWAAEHL